MTTTRYAFPTQDGLELVALAKLWLSTDNNKDKKAVANLLDRALRMGDAAFIRVRRCRYHGDDARGGWGHQ